MYRCLVIDDEPLALNVLAGYIRKTDGLQLVDITTSPLQGLQRVQTGEADLVFLDIQMPEITGIEFMKQVNTSCKIIVTTAFPQFALEGYEYSILDYLLKPIAFERFTKAIKKLPALTSEKSIIPPDYLFVKSEYKLLRIDYSSILYLESLRDYVAIHTTDGSKILTLQSLSSFVLELPGHLFARIHKSYIVALNKINFIEKNKVVINKIHLPVGDTYKSTFNKKINYSQEG
jgi:two-component system, LytTR family, response regulator